MDLLSSEFTKLSGKYDELISNLFSLETKITKINQNYSHIKLNYETNMNQLQETKNEKFILSAQLLSCENEVERLKEIKNKREFCTIEIKETNSMFFEKCAKFFEDTYSIFEEMPDPKSLNSIKSKMVFLEEENLMLADKITNLEWQLTQNHQKHDQNVCNCCLNDIEHFKCVVSQR